MENHPKPIPRVRTLTSPASVEAAKTAESVEVVELEYITPGSKTPLDMQYFVKGAWIFTHTFALPAIGSPESAESIESTESTGSVEYIAGLIRGKVRLIGGYPMLREDPSFDPDPGVVVRLTGDAGKREREREIELEIRSERKRLDRVAERVFGSDWPLVLSEVNSFVEAGLRKRNLLR